MATPKSESYAPLSVLRPAFQLAAAQHPDLRMWFFLGTSPQHCEAKALLAKRTKDFALPNRQTAFSVGWQTEEDARTFEWGAVPVQEHVTFLGNHEDARRFEELAQAAGNCILAGHSVVSTHDLHYGRSGPEVVWFKAIFNLAWERRKGSPLWARKVCHRSLPAGTMYSVLPLNPFLASVLLIDRLLQEKMQTADDGHGGQQIDVEPAGGKDGEGGGQVNDSRSTEADLTIAKGGFAYRGHRVDLAGKPLRVLAVFVESETGTVSARELHSTIWANTPVEDDAVRRAVATARQAIQVALEKAKVPKRLRPKDPLLCIDRGPNLAWRLDLPRHGEFTGKSR